MGKAISTGRGTAKDVPAESMVSKPGRYTTGCGPDERNSMVAVRGEVPSRFCSTENRFSPHTAGRRTGARYTSRFKLRANPTRPNSRRMTPSTSSTMSGVVTALSWIVDTKASG